MEMWMDSMRWLREVILCGVLACLACVCASGAETVLYVSPSGSDFGSGSIADPFATITRARDAVRELGKSARREPITVYLRGGTYCLDKPVEFGVQDSGSKAAQVTYRAYGKEKVRILGGRVVSGFRPVTDPDALKLLDPSAAPKILQADLKALGIADYGALPDQAMELFYNGTPMTLARWPNVNFTHITGLLWENPVDVRGAKGDLVGKFIYEGDRPARWVTEKDPWAHGYWFWDWSDGRQRIASINPASKLVTLAPPHHVYGYRIGQYFYGYNLLSELDSPGEYYIDREKGLLFFMPPDDGKGEAIVSISQGFLAITGAHDLSFSGLTFDAARGTGIVANGCSNLRIENCTVSNAGQWGIRIDAGNDCRVSRCELYNLGGGGIWVQGGDRKTLTPSGNSVEDCRIHNYGRIKRMYQSGVAIYGVGNRVAHNSIHDAPHMGIFFSGNDHVIEFNEIYKVCLESNDAGAIYNGRDWTQRGTIIRYNSFHDITGFQNYGAIGVYLDDQLSGTTIYGNLFKNVTRAAFIGGGRDCVIENNIFIDCQWAVHIDSRGLGWASDNTELMTYLNNIDYKNPPYSTRYPELVNILEDEPMSPKRNKVLRNIRVGGAWEEIDDAGKRNATIEGNLTDADPMFVDAAKGDYRLKRGSPALKLGFKQLPLREIGPR